MDFDYIVEWKDEINGHGYHYCETLKECENVFEWYKGTYSHIVAKDLVNDVILYVYDEAE